MHMQAGHNTLAGCLTLYFRITLLDNIDMLDLSLTSYDPRKHLWMFDLFLFY